MNNQIINFQATCNEKQNINTLKKLIILIMRSIAKMEKRHYELKEISQEHFDVYIRLEAEDHLVKQGKLLSIGYELLSRINDTVDQIKNKVKIEQEFIDQLFEEMDILNFMDFKVTKSYFSFLHIHRQVEIKPLVKSKAVAA